MKKYLSALVVSLPLFFSGCLDGGEFKHEEESSKFPDECFNFDFTYLRRCDVYTDCGEGMTCAVLPTKNRPVCVDNFYLETYTCPDCSSPLILERYPIQLVCEESE